MSMTSHDYNDIAYTLDRIVTRTGEETELYITICEEIANTLEAANDNFDRVVFLSKAGVTV